MEESINDRNRQLNGANEQRREFDRIMTKLTEWIKNTEQLIKDPFTNDLQQNSNGLKEKYKSIQVRINFFCIDSFLFSFILSHYFNQQKIVQMNLMIYLIFIQLFVQH